jgi:hypothetical protein
MTTMGTNIKNPNRFDLSTSIIELLNLMFCSESDIIIQAELKPDSGKSRLFVIKIEANDAVDYLVVKIASTSLIKMEWDAFQQFIPKKIKGITEISHPPVFLPSRSMGGIIYPLIGNNVYEVERLLDYCKHAELDTLIQDVFEDELFENLQFLWGRGSLQSQYTFHNFYSHLLPYHLILEESLPLPEEKTFHIDLNLLSASDYKFKKGEYVTISNGRISSIYEQDNAITLKPVDNELGSRIFWKSKRDISSYELNHVLNHPLVGRVQKTRSEQIAEYVQLIFQQPIDRSVRSIQLSNGDTVPNPLMYLEPILQKSVAVRFACIHGDLNLENILVEHYEHETEGRDHIGHLIDFDASHRDHVLRDPIKLETDIMTRFLPELLVASDLSPEIVFAFFEALHNAVHNKRYKCPNDSLKKPFEMIISVRKLTQYYLFNPNDWTEYYYGLVLYLIGVLKYKNLDDIPIAPLPKAVAFLGASAIISILLEEKNL